MELKPTNVPRPHSLILGGSVGTHNMSSTLYVACAEVLSLAQSKKDDLDTGFAPKLRQICHERLEELQEDPSSESDMEMLALKMESDTWGLLQVVMPCVYPRPTCLWQLTAIGLDYAKWHRLNTALRNISSQIIRTPPPPHWLKPLCTRLHCSQNSL